MHTAALTSRRLASEAANSEAGDVGYLRNVGRLEEDPNQLGGECDAMHETLMRAGLPGIRGIPKT
jgi:hypothetical protein